MQQIIQSLQNGKTILEEIPAPTVKDGQLLIQTTKSLVSLGTERMLIEFGKANLIQKAKQQPDKVKMVLDKIKTDGLLPTLETVYNKLQQPIPLGYCNVGKVVGIGKGVTGFSIGDRVASNGHHADFVSIPQNLVAAIPDKVSDEAATFTVIGSIGLQGMRLLKPAFGETVVVIGLGLIGLVTAQLLLANGCQVIGIDFDKEKLKIAKSYGVKVINPNEGEDAVATVLNHTNGVGADGVIITASTKNNKVISDAAKMSRKRGKIVLIGVIGLDISRADFYEKELSFQVSCSYGPGRYDDNYEGKGIDYPLPYVRWTVKRNFETILEALATQRLNVDDLITEVVELDDFEQIYGNIKGSHSIASLLSYKKTVKHTATLSVTSHHFNPTQGVIGIIGAGNFTKMLLLPALKKCKAQIKYIASAGGVTGTILAQKYGISKSTTDYKEMLRDTEVDAIIIATQHNSHAAITIEALQANKNVFVEKPLALNPLELENILEAYKNNKKTVTVGFNRRFSPHIQKLKTLLPANAPKNFIATMNAGFIPSDVWVHDLAVGGGRIIGEACHYIDLITYLSGSKVTAVCMSALGKHPQTNTDNASILLTYENGDQGVINYFSNGSKSYAKERIEVFSQNQTYIIDNFRTLNAYGVKGFSKLKTKLDKGHFAQFQGWLESLKAGGAPLIPFDDIINTSKASFAAIDSLKERAWVDVS